MRQSAFLRYFSILFGLLLLLNLFSCKTRKDIPDEYSEYIFENKTDFKSYFVKIDSVNKSYAEGRFYSIDNDLTMQAECFKAKLFKNKCFLIVEKYRNKNYGINDIISSLPISKVAYYK